MSETTGAAQSTAIPNDFLFELTAEELAGLRLQFATSKTVRGGTRYMPFAFTEQGVAMLSTVLKSERAIQTNIAIMRAFVKIREFLSSHRELARKLEDLERKYESHDHKINAVFEAIRQLMAPPTKPKRRIGF